MRVCLVEVWRRGVIVVVRKAGEEDMFIEGGRWRVEVSRDLGAAWDGLNFSR